MNLDEFVTETLGSLVRGVRDAQAQAEPLGAKINPYKGSAEAVQEIDFDIELTTVAGTTTEGKLGVFVGPVGLGTRGQSDATSQSVGRIRFSVPIELPVHRRKSSDGD